MDAVVIAVACVVLLNLYAAVLIVLRAKVYGVRVYRPMLLNIGLSFTPVLLSILAIAGATFLPAALPLVDLAQPVASTALWVYLILGTAAWLLFFPNSVYLITELNFSHRRAGTPVPLWYDIVHTLTLTASGLGNAVLSLAVVQTGLVLLVFDPARGEGIPVTTWLFATVAILLGAIGVYLGRYLRLNSWDVRHPSGMLRKARDHFGMRGRALESVGFILTHAILIALLYVPAYSLGYSAVFA